MPLLLKSCWYDDKARQYKVLLVGMICLLAGVMEAKSLHLFAGEIPSVTSMQRRLGGAASNTAPAKVTLTTPQATRPKTIGNGLVKPDSGYLLPPAEPKPIEAIKRLPTVTPNSGFEQPNQVRKPVKPSEPNVAPKRLPTVNSEKPATREPELEVPPKRSALLPKPNAETNSLPTVDMAPDAPSPGFNPWHPPGIFENSTEPFRPVSEMIDEDDRNLLFAPPLSSTTHTMPDGRQVAYWDGELLAASQRSQLNDPIGFEVAAAPLIDRSLCPTIPWTHADDFSSTPIPSGTEVADAIGEQANYDDKHEVPTQRPWIEWGRRFYGSGITPPSETWLGKTNLVQQQLYLYGDYRTGLATGRNNVGRIDNLATRLNLDLDYRITATERFHAFFGPLNRATQFTRLERNGDHLDYQPFYNLNPVTAFFEGDVGALLGGADGTPSPFELPVTAGVVPLLFQNGVWMEDAASGLAFAIPARHSRALNWANFDATFFALFDQINSPAFGADNHAAEAFGTAWFIDAYDGYIESGYAYLNDREGLGRSYHNATASFTRRYFDRVSNSVRVIINAGQDLPKADRTADGVLLLVENSLVTPQPYTLVPYCNLFAGWDRPQSVARAGVAGGVLRNTGINFEIDGLNGYPTLDFTGADTAGGSIGLDLIGKSFDRQWIVEGSFVTPHGDRAFITGDQYALGTRYQFNLSHRTLVRFDTMYGWRENVGDIYGSRVEYRWKF